jgi:hypothetical protein
MAELVARTGVSREKDFMYFVKDGAVWRVPRKQPGQPKGRQERVTDAGISQDTNFIYFLGKDGNVWRAKRAVGGQKRKKTTRRTAAKKATKRTAARRAGSKPKKKKTAVKAKKKTAKKGKRR